MTLLSVDSKVMGSIITQRIQNGVDGALLKDQAGLRENKWSTVEQMFLLRNSMEQVKEWSVTFKKLSTQYTVTNCEEL